MHSFGGGDVSHEGGQLNTSGVLAAQRERPHPSEVPELCLWACHALSGKRLVRYTLFLRQSFCKMNMKHGQFSWNFHPNALILIFYAILGTVYSADIVLKFFLS